MSRHALHGGGAGIAGTRRRAPGNPLRAALIALLALLAVVVSGCSAIPLTGPVGTLPARDVQADDEAPNFNVAGPTGGESPEAIVRGFFKAGLSASDNYAIAREYMTKELAASWNAGERTLVYDNDPKYSQPDGTDERLTAEVRVTRTINGVGVRSDSPKGSLTNISFSLTQVGDEWRLAKAPNGIMVESSSFDLAFAPVSLYFYSDTQYSTLVPDVRWMAKRQGRAASVAAALLAGPAPYLKGAVLSAFPDNSTLTKASVPIENKVATVDVPESVLTDATDDTRQRMLEQLDRTLADGNTISSVKLSADQVPVDVGAQVQQAQLNPAPDGVVVGLKGDTVVRYESGAVQSVAGGDTVGTGLSSPTMSPVQDAYAVLAGNRTELKLLTQDGTTRSLIKGAGLAAPSFDSRSWVWTAEAVPGAPVQAVRAAGGAAVELKVDSLGDGTITSVRVSADATRLAMTLKRKDGDHLLIAGIQRDAKGAPTGLAPAMDLTISVPATRVGWLSDQELLVYAPGAKNRVVAETVDLDRRSSTWTMVLGLTSLAVAPGTNRAVLAVNGDAVLTRDGSTWRQSAKDLGVKDLSYRG